MLEDKDFGYDYEEYPLGYIVPGLENKMVEIVKVPRHNFTGTTKEAIFKARDWAYCNLLYKSLSIGVRIYHFNKESVNKFTDFTAIRKSDNIGIHLAVLKQIENIVFKSIEVELHPDFLKKDGKRLPENGYNPNIIIHRMYGCAEIDGSFYRIKTTVRESLRRNEPEIPHSFEVKEIEMFDGSLSFGEISDSQHSNDASNISISATKLLKNVEMSYWKEKYFFEA